MFSIFRVSLLSLCLSFLVFFGFSYSVNAQSLQEKGLAGTYNIDMAAGLRDACAESGSRTNCTLEDSPPGGSTICSGNAFGEECTSNFSDGSRIVSERTFSGSFRTSWYASSSDSTPVIDDAGFGDDVGDEEALAAAQSQSCGPTDFGCHILKLPGMLFTGLGFIFLTLSGIILYLAGTVFNWVVLRTVFQFGEYFGTSEGMLIAWGVMRDIANIGLLFGFIFMGVLLILNVDGGGGHGHGGGLSAKKAIPRLIIFAVLLNFSLFASQAVIDVANAFGSTFTSLAGQTECEDGTAGRESLEACATNVGISGKILQAAGVTAIFDSESGGLDNAMANLLGRPYSYAVSLIMLSIFVLVTAMVLLAGAIMLIIRVVILTLLMVTSPVGFAGMVIPGLSGIASKWWHMLISQAFFAPVFLLLIFISVKLTENLNTGSNSLASAIIANQGNTVAGNMQVVMVFLIVIGFMIASLIAASKMGAMGASFATNSASALVFGATARGANFAVGGGARALRVAQQRTGAGGRVGEVAVNRLLRPLEKTNLDLRKLPGASAGLGAAGITAGAKAAEHATYADIAHQFSDIKGGKGGQKLHEEYEAEKKMKALDAYHGDGDMAAADKTFLASLSAKELEQLHGIKDGVATLAENLSSEQFNKLMESKELTDLEKGKLKGGRFSKLTAKAATGTDTEVKDLIKNLGKSDLENLPPSLLTPKVLNQLSDKQRDDLAGSTKLNAEQRGAVKSSSKQARFEDGYKAAATPADKYAHVVGPNGIRNLSVAQVAKLESTILTDPAVATELTPAMLIKLQDEEKLSADNIARIGSHIRGTSASAGYSHVATGAGAAYWT